MIALNDVYQQHADQLKELEQQKREIENKITRATQALQNVFETFLETNCINCQWYSKPSANTPHIQGCRCIEIQRNPINDAPKMKGGYLYGYLSLHGEKLAQIGRYMKWLFTSQHKATCAYCHPQIPARLIL
jgi:hypothetical protein